jgi:hypothetical protein
MPELDEWDSFYVIVGSSAGALIGLQFVVMTLIAERPPIRAPEAGAAFGTPTIVHFSATLLLSALVRVPWHVIVLAAALWGLLGVSGVAYSLVVARRMRKQSAYKPDFEDWIFFCVMPVVAYVVLTGSAVAAPAYLREALFGVGASALLLLFTGIHNAWDSIAYLVFVRSPSAEAQQDKKPENGKQ